MLIGLFAATAARAEDVTVVPYGDYCAKCTHYGSGAVHPTIVVYDEAADALVSYFRERGLDVQRLISAGRFIRADVVRGNKVIDTVIFDRRTGRIRSIF